LEHGGLARLLEETHRVHANARKSAGNLRFPFWYRDAYVQLGEKSKALEYLEKAYEQPSLAMTEIAIEAVFDPLRPDPRFQDLLQRVGLNQLRLEIVFADLACRLRALRGPPYASLGILISPYANASKK